MQRAIACLAQKQEFSPTCAIPQVLEHIGMGASVRC